MSNNSVFEGRCTCGEIRYRLTSRPMIVHACHCSECQRLSGGAFAINAMIESDRVETLSGEPVAVPVSGTSGKPQTIYRCPSCQVALWSHYPGGGPKICFVRVGTLEEPGRLPPDIHIFTSTRLTWLPPPQGVPAFAEYYAAKDYWPAESLERRRRLKDA